MEIANLNLAICYLKMPVETSHFTLSRLSSAVQICHILCRLFQFSADVQLLHFTGWLHQQSVAPSPAAIVDLIQAIDSGVKSTDGKTLTVMSL